MRLKVIAVSVVLLFLVTSSLGILSGNAQGSVNALNEASSSSYGTYNVTFEEKGLPSGIYWGVNVNSSGFLSQGTQITVHLANGTYNYNVSVENSSFDPVYPSGSFLVSGNPVNIPVQFRNVTYPVVFSDEVTRNRRTTDTAITFNLIMLSLPSSFTRRPTPSRTAQHPQQPRQVLHTGYSASPRLPH